MPQFVFGACLFIPVAVVLTMREEIMAYLELDHDLMVTFMVLGSIMLLAVALFVVVGIKDLAKARRKRKASRELLKKWGIKPEDLE